jgi:CO dehydrogenase maturation factor
MARLAWSNIDGEAGLEQINRQVMRGVDTLIVVSDATSRGIQTAALIKKMVQDDRVIRCEKIGLVFNSAETGCNGNRPGTLRLYPAG